MRVMHILMRKFLAYPSVMTFPTKFKHLLELEDRDVEMPEQVFVTYSVCACETHSCGWGGWTLESVRRSDPMSEPAWLGRTELPADTNQQCPRCSRPLYRTGVSLLLEPTAEQPVAEHVETAPIEYADDPDHLLAQEWAGIDLELQKWTRSDDHEHCQVCGGRISSDPYDYTEAYTNDKNYWLCPTCFDRIERATLRPRAENE